MNIMPIGENLKTIRENKGISQKELANLAKITSGYISKIEKDKVNPSVDKVKKIVIALEISSDKLLFDENEMEPAEEFKMLFKKASELGEDQKRTIVKLLKAFIMQATAEELNRTDEK